LERLLFAQSSCETTTKSVKFLYTTMVCEVGSPVVFLSFLGGGQEAPSRTWEIGLLGGGSWKGEQSVHLSSLFVVENS
jgi:hypothetical protein